MNAVVVAVGLMLVLSLARVHVVVAMIAGAVAGGLVGGLGLEGTLLAFNAGLGNGAKVALSYALLGAFAVAISQSGLAHMLADRALALMERQASHGGRSLRWALLGLLLAVCVSYRRPRRYDLSLVARTERADRPYNGRTLAVALLAVVAAFGVQLWLDSMILGALVGFVVFTATGVVRWREADDLFSEGAKMMAVIGFIMLTAGGFAEVLTATGQIKDLAASAAGLIGDNRALGALLLLLLGMLVTLGIGSSFSSVPILAAILGPLCLHLGFSPLAIVCLIGTAGALGDSGSPASDSTLGPTSGLNVDGQHSHIWDTVVPSFLHFSLPMLMFGWAAVLWL